MRRILWLDNLKGFLILFVLLSHSLPPLCYRHFFTPFFLTMFFFVSGYTFSIQDRFFVFLRKKCRRLLLPLFFLGGTRLLASIVLFDSGKRLSMFPRRLAGLFLQRSGIYDEMWFLSCLFVSCMIFYGILTAASRITDTRSSEHRLIFLFSSVCLLLGFFIIYALKIKLPWETELALVMTEYTALGYLYRQYEAVVDAWKKTPLLFCCVFYAFLTFRLEDDTDIHMETFGNPFLFLFLSFLIILPVLYLCKALSKTRLHGILSFLGQNTLFYFAFGGFIRIFFYAVTDRFGFHNPYLLSILCALITAALMAVPAQIVHTYFPWMIGLSKPAEKQKGKETV